MVGNGLILGNPIKDLSNVKSESALIKGRQNLMPITTGQMVRFRLSLRFAILVENREFLKLLNEKITVIDSDLCVVRC